MDQAPEHLALTTGTKKIPKRLNSDGHVLDEAELGVHQTPWGQAQPWLQDLLHPNSDQGISVTNPPRAFC